MADQPTHVTGTKDASELRLAEALQRQLLPASAPSIPGLDIAGASRPGGIGNGDYFDYIPMAGGRTGIVIGDISGHGLSSALVMMGVRAYARAFSLDELVTARALSRLNEALVADAAIGHFATMLVVDVTPEGQPASYANAAHPTGYLLDRCGHVKTRLASLDPPLGVLKGQSFTDRPIEGVSPGDVIVLVTDGIEEALSRERAVFGPEGVQRVIREHRDRSARDIVAALFGAVGEHSPDPDHQDDMTAVTMKVEEDPHHP